MENFWSYMYECVLYVIITFNYCFLYSHNHYELAPIKNQNNVIVDKYIVDPGFTISMALELIKMYFPSILPSLHHMLNWQLTPD